jgi:hypothetical protein
MSDHSDTGADIRAHIQAGARANVRGNKQATLDPVFSEEKANEISAMPQRRSTPRFPFSASAIVTDLDSRMCLNGRTSDIGAGGCYVDTLAPLRVGSRVRVRIEQGSKVFEAMAMIAYAHTSMGMGMRFTGVGPTDQGVLAGWLAELNGEEVPEQVEHPGRDLPEKECSLQNLQEMVNHLVQLMVRNQLITQSEGAELLRLAKR